jgi:hypothetical protein
MPKRITPLSDTKIRAIKSAEKPQKKFNGGGLFLLVSPTGGKLWRLNYRIVGVRRSCWPLVPTPKYRLLRPGESMIRQTP